MLSQLATLEDAETNRHIQFSVQYGIENSDVRILGVTPTKVSFICPTTNTFTRSMGVHTDAGRRLLSDRLRKSGRVEAIRKELVARQTQLVNA